MVVNKFKIGDKVKVYDIDQSTDATTEDTGIVEEVDNNRLWVRMDNWGAVPKNAFWFHEKQCRQLVKKSSEIKLPKKSSDRKFSQGITYERYRQMKLKLKRRWKQIEELEKDLNYCVTEIGQVLELAKRQDQKKEDIENWLKYLYDYWKKYE